MSEEINKEEADMATKFNSIMGFNKQLEGMGGFFNVLSLHIGGVTQEELIEMYPGVKKIVEAYNPQKEYGDFEKRVNEVSLHQVQVYLRNTLRVLEEGTVKENFTGLEGKVNDKGMNYAFVTLTPIEEMEKSKSREEIKTSFMQAVETAYELLQGR